MAKAIKRVGLIFLAVAIICLMAIGVLLGATSAKNVSENSFDLNNENLQLVADKSYTLSGNNDSMARIWDEAIQYSLDNNGANVNVKLAANWTARSVNEDETTFGSTDGENIGFNAGRIAVSSGATITLDLNGFTINRNLNKDSNVNYGSIFVLIGSNLNIKDSKFNSDVAASTAINNPTALASLPYGKIIGGCGKNDGKIGGAIRVLGKSTLNFYGGMVLNNISQGDGIVASEGAGGVINFYDGIIANNEGIGLASRNGDVLNISGGVIYNNTGEYGAVKATSTVSIKNCVIKNNQSTLNYGAVYISNDITIGSGLIINGNKNSAGEVRNIYLNKGQTLKIKESLQNSTKTTNVGIVLANDYNLNCFTNGYKKNNETAPSNFFVSDDKSKIVAITGDEVSIGVPINRPTDLQNNYFVYTGNNIEYFPIDFNNSTMEIKNNTKKDIGIYSVEVSTKLGYVWSDKINDQMSFSFEIIHPGVVLKDNSNFDYIYKDSNNIRQNYKDNKIIHKVSESETTSNYVIGNIAPKTTLKQFVGNIRKECGYIKIYNGNILLYDGTTSNDASDSIYVATGYKIELYKNSNGTELLDIVYLSVLGDVVADGVINTLDVTLINRLSRGEIALSDLSIEQQLAAMVDNKGKVTSTDGKILLNVIGGNTETNSYFESNKNITNDYMLWDLSIDSVTGKTYRVGSEITTASLVNNAIIGNIAANTKASDFKIKLAAQLGVDISLIAICKANGAVASDNDYIGTGSYINYNGNTANKIYLSVLGDLTGDGVVNTADITYLNRIVNGNVELATDNIKDKLTILSASIQNKGNITTADSETLLNYIGGIADLTKYF